LVKNAELNFYYLFIYLFSFPTKTQPWSRSNAVGLGTFC